MSLCVVMSGGVSGIVVVHGGVWWCVFKCGSVWGVAVCGGV